MFFTRSARVITIASPEQRTALFAEYASQETAAPVVREESYTLPKWMEERFGTENRSEDVRSIVVRNGKIETSFSAGKFGGIDFDYTPDRVCDLLKTIAGGVFKNMKSLSLDIKTSSPKEIQTLIDCISGGKLLNMRDLYIKDSYLGMGKKLRLLQALLNSHSSSLEELYVYGASFEFAKAMCKKKDNFPQLNQIGLGIPLVKNLTELRRNILSETGVLISGALEGPDWEDELYREWERMHSQKD